MKESMLSWLANHGVDFSRARQSLQNRLRFGVSPRNLARMIHERFCCNRRCLTQARRARLAEKRDRQAQGLHVTRFALLARRFAISQRTVMNNAG